MTIQYPHPEDLEDHIRIAMAKEEGFIWEPTVPITGGRYLQLGTGYKEIRGWMNWDYPDWDADDGEPMPLPDDFIDGIVCYHSMDHFQEPIRVLAEIQRVLVPGGWFVCVVPHYSSELWNSDITHIGRFGTETWRNIFSERHYKHDEVIIGQAIWKFRIQFNMTMALTERNTVLVTHMIKEQ